MKYFTAIKKITAARNTWMHITDMLYDFIYMNLKNWQN